MTEEDTIKINKQDLWKYSTFLLIAVLIVGIIVVSGGGKGTGSAVGPAEQEGVNLKVFEDNPDLYPSIGSKNAKHTVIEFADFQCPYCALASGIPEWTEQYGSQYGDLVGVSGHIKQAAENGEIRYVYVPLAFLGQESINAAEAGYCANEQGKFFEMHDAIFAASTGPEEHTGKYEKENLKIIAQNIDGLDTSKFESCLDGEKYLPDVKKVLSDTQNAGVRISTPQIWVDGKKAQNPTWTVISDLIA